MNWKVVVIVISSIVALGVFAVIGALVYKFFTYRNDVTLAEGLLISDQWQEIDLRDLLKPLSKDTQRIYVAAPTSFKAFDVKRGIVAPDGTVIVPEIQAVD